MYSLEKNAGHRSAAGSRLPGAIALLMSLCLATSAAQGNERGLSDPMRPNWYGLKAKAKKLPRIPELSSIIASDDRRLAVINGKVMREGERKNGVLLRQVLPDRVLVVTADRQLHALKLSKPKIGKEPR